MNFMRLDVRLRKILGRTIIVSGRLLWQNDGIKRSVTAMFSTCYTLVGVALEVRVQRYRSADSMTSARVLHVTAVGVT